MLTIDHVIDASPGAATAARPRANPLEGTYP